MGQREMDQKEVNPPGIWQGAAKVLRIRQNNRIFKKNIDPGGPWGPLGPQNIKNH